MLSKVAYILSLALMLYASFVFYPRWQKPNTESAISWDVSGYYWYLPSIFIYNDIKGQGFKDSILERYRPTNTDFQQAFLHESGNYVLKYSSGQALMMLPFFAIAHMLAPFTEFPADGFSAPYQLIIQTGGLLVALLGLWYFRKLLLRFFSDSTTAVCLLLLVFGTNYLNYGAIDTGMTHSWLFTLYVFLLLNTDNFYRNPSRKYAIRIGLLCGLATLTRPTEIISALIPLLWGLENISISSLKERLTFFKKHYSHLFTSFFTAAGIVFIQIAYWKYASGDWMVYSYQDQGFTWLHPHIIGYIISPHNGWLAYTPLMGLSFIGIWTLIKFGKNRVALLSFFAINLYLVMCWEFYWHGGRFMVQSYVVLFFPIATLIQYLSARKTLRLIATPVVILLVYINIWTTYHAHAGPGLLDFDTITPAYYFKVIGRWDAPSEATIKLKDNPEAFKGNPEKFKQIFFYDFEEDTLQTTGCDVPPIDQQRSGCINSSRSGINIRFSGVGQVKDWIRVSGLFHCVQKEWNTWNIPQFMVAFEKNGESIKTNMIRVQRFLQDGETKEIFLDAKVPDSHFDAIKIMLWNADSDKTMLIDNVKLFTLQ